MASDVPDMDELGPRENPYSPSTAPQTVSHAAPPIGALWRGYFWTLVAAAILGIVMGPIGVIVGLVLAGVCGVVVFAAGTWFLRIHPTWSVLGLASSCGALTGFTSFVLLVLLLTNRRWSPGSLLIATMLSLLPTLLGAVGGGVGAWFAVRGKRS